MLPEPKYRFPGVKPFAINDQDIFKGREKYSKSLYSLLQSKNMIVFYAESGTGKSSLINAGLIPIFKSEIQKHKYLPVKIRFFANENTIAGKANIDENILISSIIAQLAEYKKDFSLNNLPFVDDEQKDLWHEAKLFQRNDYNLLWIFDQAEEIFTYSPKQILLFKQQVYTLLSNYLPSYLDQKIANHLDEYTDDIDDHSEATTAIKDDLNFIYESLNTRMLFAVREDKLGLFYSFTDFFPDILKNIYRLNPLEENEAKEAITLPAQLQGQFSSPQFKFTDEGLAELMQRLVEDDGTYDPFSIQLNCSYIERALVIKQGKLEITETDIPEKGIIEKEFFDNVWTSIPEAYKDDINSFKKTIAKKLIDPNYKIRIKVNQGNFLPPPVIKILIDEGLIREDQNPNEIKYYELSHDRLVKPILENYNQQKAEEDKKEANKLYEKLIRKATETYNLTDQEKKAIHILTEQHLIKNLARTTISLSEALLIPGIRKDVIDYFIEEKLFAAEPADSLQISNDIYLSSILKSYQTQKSIDDLEKAQKTKKKTNRVITWTIIFILVGSGFYAWTYYTQRQFIKQVIMFNNVNQYLEKNNLRKAYGMYSRLDMIRKVRYFNSQMDSNGKKLTYTDLPTGLSITALSNNHIASILDTLNTEIWTIKSSDSIKLFKSYDHITLSAVSPDGNYMALYSSQHNNLTLYNAKTNKDTIICKSPGKEFYFSFSSNNNYFYYYSDSVAHFFDLNDSVKLYKFNCNKSYKYWLKDIVYASADKVYSDFGGYLFKWQMRDSLLRMNISTALDNEVNPWCYIKKNVVLFITTAGLSTKNLATEAQSVILKGNFSKFETITRTSYTGDTVYLSSRKSKINNNKIVLKRGTFSALGFYKLGGSSIYEPFKDHITDKLSVTAGWSKCITRDKGKIYLIDNKTKALTLLTFLKQPIYDISDDGKYILYVEETVSKSGSQTQSSSGKDTSITDTSAVLYLYNMANSTVKKVGNLAKNPDKTQYDTTSIYGSYFFHFNTNSDMFAYMAKNAKLSFQNTKNAAATTKGSFNLVVKNISDLSTIYNSTITQAYVSDDRNKDFTSTYIHVKNIDESGVSKEGKEGIRLLNKDKRNIQYFLNLYPKMSPQEWEKEVIKANINTN